MTTDKELLRADRSALESQLRSLGCTIRGTNTTCPNPTHDDKNPSASIYRGDDGAWRVKCHVPSCNFCGDVFDLQALSERRPVAEVLKGLSSRSDTPAKTKKPPKIFATRKALEAAAIWNGDGPPLKIETTFTYTDPSTGQVDLEVFRLLRSDGTKSFKQASPAAGGWTLTAPPKPWPLYNRTRVRDAAVVILVEGEKCVHALTEVLPDGFAATTSPAGAKNARNADWSPLAGKIVYAWPDMDDDGRRYDADAIEIIQRLDRPPEIHLLDPADLGLTGEGDDVVDFLAKVDGESIRAKFDAVDVALSKAKPVNAAADLDERIEDIASGCYAPLGLPDTPSLQRLAQPLLPGALLVLAGSPGGGKSFLLMQWCLRLFNAGVPIAIFALEEDRAFWLMRLLAVMSGRSELTETTWVAEHAAEVRAIRKAHRSEIDGVASRIKTAGDRQVPRAELVEWVKARAAGGCRLIAVDPVTLVEVSGQPWIDDQKLMVDLKAIAREFGCSIVLVTHPRGARGGKGGPPTLDDLAGGLAFPRFAQTVFWVRHHKGGRRCRWVSPRGDHSSGPINSSVLILKARNGRGSGMEVALEFDGGTLRFAERGVIVDDDAEAKA
jgi:hypothetical protein